MAETITFTLEPIVDRTAIGPAWTALAADASFFTSWLWIGTWLAALPGEIQPFLLSARREGRTIGLAVLCRRSTRRRLVMPVRRVHFNTTGDPAFDCMLVEHNAFAAAPADLPALWRGLVRWFPRADAAADELVIGGVVEQPGLEDAEAAGLLHSVQRSRAFLVELSRLASHDGDAAALLSRNSRQQLARAMRSCAALGPLVIAEATTVERAWEWFEAMKTLHVASWSRRGIDHAFVHPFFETFNRALLAEGVPRGAIQMLRVTAGDTVLGYLYNFRRGGRVYAFQSGFSAHDDHRPGYICHALAIGHNFRRGEAVYDFMAGDNRLKRSFATADYSMSWHVLQRRLLRFRIENGLRALKHRIVRR